MADVGGRYAVILKREDGKEVISDMKIMEGVEPEFNEDVVDRGYDSVQADDGWKIGMIRGGSVGAVAGFGFEDELSAAGRSETGVTRVDDAKNNSSNENLDPVSHEKQRGLRVVAKDEAKAERATAKTERVTARAVRKTTRKAAKVTRKAAKAARKGARKAA